MTIFTGGSEKMRVTSDGYQRMASGTGGIQFNGDTAAANALDDYEEGTWTPEVVGSTGTPTGVTYNFISGSYRKIGDTVWIRMGVNIANVGTGGSGTLRLSGLPFTSINQGAYQEPTGAANGARWLTATNARSVYAFVRNSSTQLEFRTMALNADTALNYSELVGGNDTIGTWFTISLFYHVQ
jgi:hypothetical protein